LAQQNFTIRLPKFEGPFDLLLFFIERDELDIYDIPIATITDDFLSYIHEAEQMNIDLASEFIVVAATLMRIKAKLLLPRKQIDEQGNEIDPRAELIDRLVEYKRYKSVLDEMRSLEEERSLREKRGNTTKELQELATKALVDVELQDLTMFKLLRVFENLMRKYEVDKKRAVHTVVNYDYTIQGQQDYLYNCIRIAVNDNKKADFESIFTTLENRIHAVVTFLGLLELLNLQKIVITQGEGMNNFWLSLPEDPTLDGVVDDDDDD
jgi:segregation and condensation protein A